MIANKHISKIVAVIMAIAACLCLCAMVYSEKIESVLGDSSMEMEYESKLFNTEEILNINIIMDEAEWNDMLSNAIAEQYYPCDVEINGETFYNIGIRPKGNTSLSSIASDPDNNRYSLKLEFDQYVDGGNCYGLDKLILNNNFADATNMKEALIYDMFQYMGVDASLYNYAEISVNGQYWGVYLALEAVEESFMLRNYGANYGELYKPDSMNFGNMGGNFSNRDSEKKDFGNMKPPTADKEKPSNMPQFDSELPEDFNKDAMPDMENFDSSKKGGFNFMMGGSGADLNYTDENLDSYSTIWNCEVTDTTKKDHKRVVTALRNISQGTNLDTYMDVDNLLKYAAVHVFSVNSDSLSGMMAHNYYLYESNGMLNLLPWDYNLSLGGMGGFGKDGLSDATSTVNDAIDNAFSGTKFFDTLLEEEEYHEQYYKYLQQLVDEYILGGRFEQFYNRTRTQIDELVKKDPNALYTYTEYEKALDVLCEVVNLRGQSIDGQINGTIPSTAKEQTGADTLIDASHIDLSVMGTMNMGEGVNFSDRTSEKEGSSQFTKIDEKGNKPNMNFGGNTSNNAIQNLILYGICFFVLIGGLLFAVLFRHKKYRR
ncbi:MAG: CotH kinase family protein [Lachnospiraceae bacterium]